MVEEKYWAGTLQYYQGQLKRLKNSGLGKDTTKAIENFLNDFQYNSRKRPTYHMLYFHCYNLRSFANMLGDRFLSPEKVDILQGLKELREV